MGYAITPADEPRAAHREKPLGTKLHDGKLRPVAITMANRNINILPCEVHVMICCRNPEINLRMGLCKPTQSSNEPFGSKIR